MNSLIFGDVLLYLHIKRELNIRDYQGRKNAVERQYAEKKG